MINFDSSSVEAVTKMNEKMYIVKNDDLSKYLFLVLDETVAPRITLDLITADSSLINVEELAGILIF